MSSPFRCGSCGNRTRFDVVSSRRTKAFWHFSLGGERSIDEEEVLDEQVESVTCRWCGSSTTIEQIGAFESNVAQDPDGASDH
ncbi:MAG TPA: hypothetical protein VKR27_07540 [Acidimicrobiales bacterium]|nr:hypothetical protein [Acidimicrobiales bacterium]